MLTREYKRRSLLDRKELLVTIDRSESNFDDDDDELRRLKQQRDILKQEQAEQKRQTSNVSEDEDVDDNSELKSFDMNSESQTILNFRKRYQNEMDIDDVALVPKTSTVSDSSFDMLSDSSSSTADDETSRISELYASVGDQIDGKHRIKIKGDELKIKGRPAKQRPKLMDAQFFQPQNDDNNTNMNQPSAPFLLNSAFNAQAAEPDFTSFDFLNDYEEKAQ